MILTADPTVDWFEGDCRAFEQGLLRYGKNFSSIRATMVLSTFTIGVCYSDTCYLYEIENNLICINAYLLTNLAPGEDRSAADPLLLLLETHRALPQVSGTLCHLLRRSSTCRNSVYDANSSRGCGCCL